MNFGSKSIKSASEVSRMISEGQRLLLAGELKLLKQLPRGQWIAGTIPYFMSEDGGLLTSDMIQVETLPAEIESVQIKMYAAAELPHIPKDYPKNGLSCIIIPAFSSPHFQYAKDCSTWSGIFDRPLFGWIAGFNLSLPNQNAFVLNGLTGEVADAKAVVMHMNLRDGFFASIEIVNLFKQGAGDEIQFQEVGFEVNNCLVNGQERNFHDYIIEKQLNLQLPLVADYMGAPINVSLKALDAVTKKVHLYGPVFPSVQYRQAEPIGDYETEFKKKLGSSMSETKPLFSCNCILNYLYANLEGKKTGPYIGPMTFGEVAYMLLNQTLVHVNLHKTKRT